MSTQQLSTQATQQEPERIIPRMQAIRQAIRASRQPAFMRELQEPESLGREYARILERPAGPSGDPAHV